MGKYEETLERAREIYANPREALKDHVIITNEGTVAVVRVALLDLFSEGELVENEDEKVIREMLEYFDVCKKRNKAFTERVEQIDRWVAWLEKRKESSPIEERCKEKPNSFTDESEDERVRKWIVNLLHELHYNQTAQPLALKAIEWLEKQKERHMPNSTELIELWDKEAAMLKEKDFRGDEWRLAQNAFLDGFGYGVGVKQKEQKPAEWSEEDNIGWDEAFACVTRAEKAAKNESELQNAVTAEKWLKEIKFKYCVYPVKQEWSEEDERMLKSTKKQLRILQANLSNSHSESMSDLEYSSQLIQIEKCVSWLDIRLKSLRPQPHWKPSEEQMEALRKVAYNLVGTGTETDVYLVQLHDALNKLM